MMFESFNDAVIDNIHRILVRYLTTDQEENLSLFKVSCYLLHPKSDEFAAQLVCANASYHVGTPTQALVIIAKINLKTVQKLIENHEEKIVPFAT